MKKVLSLVFAVIFAFSALTTAFAAKTLIQCPYCDDLLESEAEYNKHISTTCPVVGSDAEKDSNTGVFTCPYGCGASFSKEAEYENHLEVCFDKDSESSSIAEKVEDFFLNLDFRNDILAKALELLGKINFSDLLVKAIDLIEKAVEGIMGAI